MKKLLILLILLFALPAYAQQCGEESPELARLSPAMMGGVPAAAAACTTGNDSALVTYNVTTDDGSTVSTTFGRAQSFTYSSNFTLTEIQFPANGFTGLTSGTGTVTVSLYDNSTTVPGTQIAATVVTKAQDADLNTWTLATPWALGVSGTTYWIVWEITTGNVVLSWARLNTGTYADGNGAYRVDAEWSTATHDHEFIIMGCNR